MDAPTTYRAFLGALNAQDLDAAAGYVDVDAYRENCVGFTRGFVPWPEAVASLRRVWQGLPDLRVDIEHVHGDDQAAVAFGRVRGANTGRLYGVPPTRRAYEALFFDYVRLVDGRIVERVQQADVLSQMRQLYGRALGTAGITALLWRS